MYLPPKGLNVSKANDGYIAPQAMKLQVEHLLIRLGKLTPNEIAELFDISPDEGKIRRGEVFKSYMTAELNMGFSFTAPTADFPTMNVWLKTTSGEFETKIRIDAPISLADFLKLEGAQRRRGVIGLTTQQSQVFRAICIMQSTEGSAEELYRILSDDWLFTMIASDEIERNRANLMVAGIYPDELNEWYRSQIEGRD